MAAVLVLVALVAGLLLWQRPWAGDDPAADVAYPDDPAAALTRQVRAMSQATTVDDFADAAGDPVWAEAVWAARDALGVDDVSWRYLSGGESPAFDDGDGRATVDVGGTRVDLRVRPDGGGFAVVGSLGSDEPLPVWLAGEIEVERDDDVTVVLVDGGDADLDVVAASDAARATAVRTLGETDRPLVVVSPSTAERTAALLGQPIDAIEQIAGVSTRLADLGGPAVVLNPAVFSAMDDRAREVVLAHESTHVLTDSIGSGADTWVVEGFADYVALRFDDAPLRVTAGQVLEQVAADGPPERLPTTEDFDGATVGLGAVYESAWMAFRLLDDRYGSDAVVGFYDDVLAGTPVETALGDAFGLTLDQLTQAWRDDLVRAADDG